MIYIERSIYYIMSNNTKENIIRNVKKLFTIGGYDAVSIRDVARETGVSPSVIYYYYKDKDTMLEEIFEHIRKDLGEKRGKLPKAKNVREMLSQRIDFQFEQAEDVIYILKYYTHFRKKFRKNEKGYVPIQAYIHIKEVLERGVKDGAFVNKDIDIQAKVITHAVNGFVLEYYPRIPSKKDRKKLVKDISAFIYRAIKKPNKKGGVKNGK